MLFLLIFIVGFYLVSGFLFYCIAVKNAPLVDDEGNVVDEDEGK